MKKVVITSTNPVKIDVVKRACASLMPADSFEYIPLDLESDEAEPVGREACLKQVRDSLDRASKQIPSADYFIAMEGGVEDGEGRMTELAYVIARDSKGREAVSQASSFDIPPKIAAEVRTGVPFADAVDSFFKTHGTKQGGGFVSILTGGLVKKAEFYLQPTLIALSTLLHSEWY